MIFLMETKCTKDKMESIKRKLNFDHCFVVANLGSGGGLDLLWKHETKVALINYTRWHITARVIEKYWDLSWQLTGFYGNPRTTHRDNNWRLLKHLKPEEDFPWIYFKDFLSYHQPA